MIRQLKSLVTDSRYFRGREANRRSDVYAELIQERVRNLPTRIP